MAGSGAEKPVFSFVSGRFHGPECWELVRNTLKSDGYDSVAPELPIEDVGVSLDDHAGILAAEEVSYGDAEFIRVGWSWGANVVTRAVESSTAKIIYIAPGFHRSTIITHPRADLINTEHGLMYRIFQLLDNDEDKREYAESLFYHDAPSAEVAKNASAGLRSHPYREEEPVLGSFPVLPLGYIALRRDFVITYESQLTTAVALAVGVKNFHSGHAPMISHPKQLARALEDLAT